MLGWILVCLAGLPTPAGQPRPTEARRLRFDEGIHEHPGRFRLSVELLYAAFRAPFIGRPASALSHGGGVSVMGDVALPWSLGIRVRGAYSAHRLPSVYATVDGQPVERAAGGRLDNTELSASLLYALDLGRVLPGLELGAGILWIHGPPGVQAGQRDQACLPDRSCEIGLRCHADDRCRGTPTAMVHGGATVDALLHPRVSLGIGFRYFALLSSPGTFPVYLQASFRTSVHF